MRQKIRDLAKRGRAGNWPGAKGPRWPVIATVAGLGLMIAMPASAEFSTAAAPSARPAYLGAKLTVQARRHDLLRRLTLPEEIGQMVQIEVTPVTHSHGHRTNQGRVHLPNA